MEIADSVVAREFLLVDAENRPAAVLGQMGDGVGIAFLDRDGTQRLVIGVDADDGPILTMGNGDASSAVAIGTPRDGLPAIRLTRPDQTESLTVALTDAGPTVFLNRGGTIGLSITLAHNGPHILLSDPTGTARVVVSNSTSDGPEVKTLDADGAVIWSANKS